MLTTGLGFGLGLVTCNYPYFTVIRCNKDTKIKNYQTFLKKKEKGMQNVIGNINITSQMKQSTDLLK